MTQEVVDFFVKVLDQTRSGEVKNRVAAIQRGEFDANPRLALNQSRRFRRWFERNNPSDGVRETELFDAAAEANSVRLDAGEYNVVLISLFDCGETETDERFDGAKTQTEWLTRMYRILDETKAEIEEYVAIAIQRCEDIPTAGKQRESSNIGVSSNEENKSAVRKEKPEKKLVQVKEKAVVPSLKPSRADFAFAPVAKYFATSPDNVVRIIRDGRGTIEMLDLAAHEAGEILVALKEHFYLDRENAKNVQVSVSGQAPCPWFGAVGTIESAVLAARGSRETSAESEACRHKLLNALRKYDVR
ncbi:MAG: hypothetical protein H7X70_00345 [Candidatus Kapabacteria bacterium]|nr:hypothetical protein [Candidatus Kapabacteria bacterium]